MSSATFVSLVVRFKNNLSPNAVLSPCINLKQAKYLPGLTGAVNSIRIVILSLTAREWVGSQGLDSITSPFILTKTTSSGHADSPLF
jgi:hypothetical protein